ncbi:MAG: TolB family protein [Conexibacter sp.]
MVSPTDKNGGDVIGDGQTIVAARTGAAVAYASRTLFGDARGSGFAGQTQYVARRTGDGWVTRAITPTPTPAATPLILNTEIPLFSDDLETAVVWAYDLPGVEGDAPGTENVYEESTSTGDIRPITVSRADPLGFDFLSMAPWGASSDARHLSLVSASRLVPEAPVGVPSVYIWDGGTLSLAGILPDGTIPAEGSDVQPQAYRAAVSADGSRVAFVSPPFSSPQLYVRIDGDRTALVSQSENPGAPDPAADVFLQWMSPDGRHVLFTSSSQLLAGDPNSGPDLYLYTDSGDPTADSNLTLISSSGSVVGNEDGTAVVGASDDASRIYYQDAANDLWLWDHGRTTLVAEGVRRSFGFALGTRLGATDYAPGASRVSEDGRFLAFLSSSTQGNDGQHALTGEVSNGHVEMYVFDADAGHLACVSCRDGGSTADATVQPFATRATASIALQGQRPGYLTADGRRVFFSTEDALVHGDSNGAADVYQYDTQTRQLSLISPGSGDSGAWFADASADGRDVFVVTRDRLVPADRDGLVDLYDARIGGGFPAPAPQPSPCTGDECQGAAPAPPGDLSIGTATFAGSGSRGATSARLRATVRHLHGRRAAVVISARVSGKGRLAWSGRGLEGGSRALPHAGAYRVLAKLTPRARATLRRVGRFRTTVTLKLQLAGGPVLRRRIAIVLHAEPARARR